MIKAMKFVGVPVSDQGRALEFYTTKLGFRVIIDQPMGPGLSVTATYGGNVNYNGSGASTTTFVYGIPAGGGSAGAASITGGGGTALASRRVNTPASKSAAGAGCAS